MAFVHGLGGVAGREQVDLLRRTGSSAAPRSRATWRTGPARVAAVSAVTDDAVENAGVVEPSSAADPVHAAEPTAVAPVASAPETAEQPAPEASAPALANKPTLMSKPPMPQPGRPSPQVVEPAAQEPETAADGGGSKGNDSAETATYTKCGRCNSAYKMTASSLPPRGAMVMCTVCGNQWYQQPAKLMTLRDGDSFQEMTDEDIAEAKNNMGSRRDSGRGGGRGGSRFTIFVGNLPYSVDESTIRDVFESVTTVQSVRLATGPDNRSKGFAFVDVPSKSAMMDAVEKMSGFELEGRPISVREGKAAGR